MDVFRFRAVDAGEYATAVDMKRRTFVESGWRGAARDLDGWVREFADNLPEYQKADPHSVSFLCCGERPIGLLTLTRVGGWGVIDNLYVAPRYRGRGCGRIMERYALAYFQKAGLGALELQTPRGGLAEGFYEHLGWRFNCDMGDGFVSMVKRLEPSGPFQIPRDGLAHPYPAHG